MTMTKTATLTTENPCWGFYGTIENAGHDADQAWQLATTAITDATQAHDGYGPEGVRDFLDSRDGRHFADMVADAHMTGQGKVTLAQAITEATRRYSAWTIGRTTARDHGIPRGLPYLTGWVTHYAIAAEATA